MKTKDMVYIAFYVCLQIVLDYVSSMLFQMPNGGSIDLGIIPLIIASYHLGVRKGLFVGVLSLIMQFMLKPPYFVNVFQFSLDYVVPVLGFGIVGWFKNIYIGSSVGVLLKTISVVLAGVFFWFPDGAVAGSAESWIFSLNYNLYYMIPTFVVIILLVPAYKKILSIVSRKN